MTPERIDELEKQVRKEHALLSAYPNVRLAVAWTELMLCVPPDDGSGESSWDIMVKAEMSPDEIIETIRKCIREEQEEGTNHGPDYLARMRLAYPQTFHPEFRSYVMGKLGMM